MLNSVFLSGSDFLKVVLFTDESSMQQYDCFTTLFYLQIHLCLSPKA